MKDYELCQSLIGTVLLVCSSNDDNQASIVSIPYRYSTTINVFGNLNDAEECQSLIGTVLQQCLQAF